MVNIVITVGPNSLKSEDLKKFANTTTLFRLNGSHNTLAWHRKAVNMIRDACPDAFILMDIPGIKPRTNNTLKLKINKGQVVSFGQPVDDVEVSHIPLTKPLPDYNSNLKTFSLNDGQFLFDVQKMGKGFIVGRAREDFELLPKKGINLPASIYNEEKQFEVYETFISTVSELNIDALGLSFVQTPEIVNKVRALRPDLLLVSKIENSAGLKNCSQIAETSDAIMIDRGDLVAEIGFENLYSGIERIACVSKSMGKPLIMATENLETMLSREVPSKSEVVSLSHSVKIGTDCFMLSEETALSVNKHIIVSWLSNFLSKLGSVQISTFVKDNDNNSFDSIWQVLKATEMMPVLVMSKSGRALSKILGYSPNRKIFILTDNHKVVNLSKLYSKKLTVLNANLNNSSSIENIRNTIIQNKSIIFEETNSIASIYVSAYVNTPRADTLTIFKKHDFM